LTRKLKKSFSIASADLFTIFTSCDLKLEAGLSSRPAPVIILPLR